MTEEKQGGLEGLLGKGEEELGKLMDDPQKVNQAKGKAEGMVEEARGILLLLGTDAFGAPDAATNAAIAGILDRERLEEAPCECYALVRGYYRRLLDWPSGAQA